MATKASEIHILLYQNTKNILKTVSNLDILSGCSHALAPQSISTSTYDMTSGSKFGCCLLTVSDIAWLCMSYAAYARAEQAIIIQNFRSTVKPEGRPDISVGVTLFVKSPVPSCP